MTIWRRLSNNLSVRGIKLMNDESINDDFYFWGIDGCKGGWFCIGLTNAGDHCSLVAADIIDAHSKLQKRGAKIALIDIPIGLSDNDKKRICDDKAKECIGPRRSSVFPVPCRQALEAFCADGAEAAKKVNHQITGRSLSKQTLAIMKKIAEVDGFMRGNESENFFREVHPEVCFWALNGDVSLAHGKKEKEGRCERLEILRRYSANTKRPLNIDAIYNKSLCEHPRKTVACDDVLDALAAALTAKNVCAKQPRTLPTAPAKDARGLTMEMVCVINRP